MISIDDLNDWVGFLQGHPQVQTPGLDALAARSHVFRHAYCTAPICSPARASALTGLSVQSTGVFSNDQTFRLVNPGKAMLVDMMSAGGYETRLIGRIDHSYNVGTVPFPEELPYSNKICPAPLGPGSFDWGPSTGTDADQPDYRFASSAIDFLNDSHSGPFFLAVGFIRTHTAWFVPQRFFDMYPKSSLVLPNPPANDLDDLGPTGKAIALQFDFHKCITDQGLWADAVQAYLASISWVDSQVARVLDALDNSAHADNTMIVLWSDHGFHLGEKFHWHKLALWERSTHVPFLISLPQQSTSTAVQACVSLRDMTPTILDYCNAAPSYAMDGRTLRPLLVDADAAWTQPVLTTREQHDHAIRTNQWRYIRYASGEKELYDSVADPQELTNLAGLGSYATVMAQLDALMPPAPAAKT